MEYRDIKNVHESAVVNDFVVWMNRTQGTDWRVIDRPDPPDAVIADGDAYAWVEHTDLYRHWEEARSETSFATRGKEHIPHSENPICDPDRRTAMALMKTLQNKLSNNSYRSAYERYGQGYLVISERDALFDKDTEQEIDRLTDEVVISGDNGFFKKVYLAMRGADSMLYGDITYHVNKLGELCSRSDRLG